MAQIASMATQLNGAISAICATIKSRSILFLGHCRVQLIINKFIISLSPRFVQCQARQKVSRGAQSLGHIHALNDDLAINHKRVGDSTNDLIMIPFIAIYNVKCINSSSTCDM